MIRARNLRNKYQKRTLRVLYGQTQAYPYAGALHSSFRAADGSFVMPLNGATLPTRTADAATYKSGLVPGLVMIHTGNDTFKVAVGGATERPFGLLANFVGGDLDDLGDENQIGVWRGPDSVVELLTPAFNPTGVTAAAIQTAADAGAPLPMYAGVDGRLNVTIGAATVIVGRLIAGKFNGTTPTSIQVELAI